MTIHLTTYYTAYSKSKTTPTFLFAAVQTSAALSCSLSLSLSTLLVLFFEPFSSVLHLQTVCGYISPLPSDPSCECGLLVPPTRSSFSLVVPLRWPPSLVVVSFRIRVSRIRRYFGCRTPLVFIKGLVDSRRLASLFLLLLRASSLPFCSMTPFVCSRQRYSKRELSHYSFSFPRVDPLFIC